MLWSRDLPPHRHKNPDKEEVYLVLRGSLLAILFDDEGNVTEKVHLNPAEGHYGIEIPPCVWHTIVVLESGTVIYEIKQGPFAPLIPENLASWAPPATDEEATRVFIQRMLEL